MTRKIYYEDSYLAQFEAQVVDCSEYKGSYLVVLDQTAFYPGGGGQPCDTGVLAGQVVHEVFEKEDIIYHKIEQALVVGEKVEGQVEIARRIDFMAQHTGEHIISGIIDRLYGYANVGFHLADTYMTADYDGELNEEQLEEIERLANEAVLTNQKIEARFYADEAIQHEQYRSKKELEGPIRLVRAGEYDCCACCGTHVNATFEVGMIKIIQAERHRGGMRLTILCGERARKYFRDILGELKQISGLHSAKIGNVVQAVERVQVELVETKQTLANRSQSYYEIKAKQYHYDRPLCIVEDTLHPQELKYFAESIIPHLQQVALILVPKEDGFQYMLMSKEKDIRPFAKRLNEVFSGKGGGKPTLCQGSLNGASEAIKIFFYEEYPSWIAEIENYRPYNEQEATDKKVILDYINQFGNTLERANEVAHLTSSAWIVNKERTKVLMAYHNIYDTWAWTGGHSDGDGRHLHVAIKEAIEETGVQNFTPVSTEIFSIDVLPVGAHIKKGKYVAAHLHLSIAYLLEAGEEEALQIKPDENSGVKWVPVEEINGHTMKEPKMQELYAKFMEKIK